MGNTSWPQQEVFAREHGFLISPHTAYMQQPLRFGKLDLITQPSLLVPITLSGGSQYKLRDALMIDCCQRIPYGSRGFELRGI